MLNFPDEYFEDEVRDGFFVNSIMKKCWAAQLEVLADVDKVCRRYDIKWYADCGTLLGAVRHGGFVPWDDDLDICMFRDDYFRFLTVASRELTNIWPHYKVLNYHNESYWEPISRIINADDIKFSVDRIEKFHGYPFSAGIDIFPLDFVCPDEEEEEARKGLFKTIFELADSEFADSIDQDTLAILAESVGKKVDRSKSPKLQLYEWGEIVSSMYRREEAKDVCLMTFWYRHNNHKYPMDLFDKMIEIPFENIMIHAPAGYDQVLKIEYGDYMKLVRTGGVHEYPHYEYQLDKVEEWLGDRSPFHISITKDVLEASQRVKKDINPRTMVKEQSLEAVKLLYEAGAEINKMILNGLEDEVLELLSECQNVAIQIGTFIEEYQGEGFVTVKHLEGYCELVYQLSQIIASSSLSERDEIAIQKSLSDLNDRLMLIEDSINKDIGFVKEVVIMPFKADYWHILDGIWKEMKDDESIRVIVMPIPYYTKSALGEVKTSHYDTEGYPDYVMLTAYNSYDIEKRHPDKIIIQYPFDNDNFVTTIDDCFYAKNLRSYTDELVYVPYFKTEEIGPGEERAYKAMDNYVLTPAVVFSDKVIVQSEGIRALYIKRLTEYFGDDTKCLWEQKLDDEQAYLFDENINVSKDLIDMPDAWKKLLFTKDGVARKVIIYKAGISGLFEHKEKMIEKIKSVLDTFEKNANNVVVIWRSDQLIDATIPTTEPKLYDEYRSLVEEFKSRGFGIFDDSGDDSRLLMLADAYYGDTDKLVQKCRKNKIPVMIQNVDVL